MLTTDADTPVVTETTVATDLPEAVKVLTDLEVQTVREHLRETTETTLVRTKVAGCGHGYLQRSPEHPLPPAAAPLKTS